jgi:hypothetical protein
VKVIIAGHRDYEDYDELLVAIDECPFEITEVVSGHARGVDQMGERWSETVLHKDATVFPADWDRFGNGAGPIRNAEMARYGEALIALWDGRQHGGTWNMIKQARLRRLKVHIHRVTYESE